MGVLYELDRGMSIAVVSCHYGGTKPTVLSSRKMKTRSGGVVKTMFHPLQIFIV
jgi:hypothetical protein